MKVKFRLRGVPVTGTFLSTYREGQNTMFVILLPKSHRSRGYHTIRLNESEIDSFTGA